MAAMSRAKFSIKSYSVEVSPSILFIQKSKVFQCRSESFYFIHPKSKGIFDKIFKVQRVPTKFHGRHNFAFSARGVARPFKPPIFPPISPPLIPPKFPDRIDDDRTIHVRYNNVL